LFSAIDTGFTTSGIKATKTYGSSGIRHVIEDVFIQGLIFDPYGNSLMFLNPRGWKNKAFSFTGRI
jgi:hypothetical protein